MEHIRRIILSLFLPCLLSFAEISLQNNWLKISLSPERGAIVRSFKYKEWGEKEIIDQSFGGLLMDHFWQQTWPGEFLDVPYDFNILKNNPAEAEALFFRLSTGQWKGNTLPGTKDILLEKRVIIPENKPYLKAVISLTNKSNTGKIVGLWEQNIFCLGDGTDEDIYLRPSLRGIRKGPPGEDFVKDVVYGWTGVVEPKSRRGMVFLMDYNHLMWLYNCFPARTTEWQYDRIALPAGKTWSTEFYILPTYGLENLAHATENFIAALSVKKDSGFLYITHQFRSAVKEVKNLVVATEYEELRTGKKYKLEEIEFENLGMDIKRKTLKAGVSCDPLVFRITVTGKYLNNEKFVDYYEYYYAGDYGENLKIDLGNPLYVFPEREKKKFYLKPDKIERKRNEVWRVLLLRGLFSDKYRLEETFSLLAPQTQIKNCYFLSTQFGNQIDYFPADYEELMSYDFIILSNVDATCLGDMGIEMIKDYVENGGNLIIFGGLFAYGNGRYRETKIEKILPVVVEGEFDIRKTKDSRVVTESKLQMKDVHCFYMHRVKPREGSKVLFTCDGYPFLVTGKFGQGNVLCFTGTVMGENKKSGFWQGKNWAGLLSELLREVQK